MQNIEKDHLLYTSGYVDRHFDDLRQAAIEDFSRYVSGWSIYSIMFFNTVARMQGLELRIDESILLDIRKHDRIIFDQRIIELIESSKNPHSMNIAEIICLIYEEVEHY